MAGLGFYCRAVIRRLPTRSGVNGLVDFDSEKGQLLVIKMVIASNERMDFLFIRGLISTSSDNLAVKVVGSHRAFRQPRLAFGFCDQVADGQS